MINLEQLNEAISVLETNVSKPHLKKDASTLLTGNLNLNNHKVVNMAMPIDKNDNVNKLCVGQKIGESHISSLKNKMFSNI